MTSESKEKMMNKLYMALIGLITGLGGTLSGNFFQTEVVKDIDQLFREMDTKASTKTVDDLNARTSAALINNGNLIHENDKEITDLKVDVAKLQ